MANALFEIRPRYTGQKCTKITVFWDMMPCTVWWICTNISN